MNRSGLKHAERVFLWPRFACYGGSLLGRILSLRSDENLHLLQTAPRAKPTTYNLSLAKTDSYSHQGKQLLNNIVKSMQIHSDPVVVPSKELIDLIQAVRTFPENKNPQSPNSLFNPAKQVPALGDLLCFRRHQ
ncbi:MAG: hypothetical protein KJ868_11730 [Gammaproteobacteria bacterium]|nr:hypothetical protein [Gammaproteobacteria bacterium]MBU2414205.1 hypothetical protein [Gammaproteobacteria bacterium]